MTLEEVKDYTEHYIVYRNGKVWSNLSHKFLKPTVTRYGYHEVSLHNNGRQKTFRLHKLVALTHIDNPNDLPLINHIDGNKTNNTVENLEWCTAKHNILHAISTGLWDKRPRGEKWHSSKLTETQVKEIKGKLGLLTQKKIAEEYGIDQSTVSYIKGGRLWAHL